MDLFRYDESVGDSGGHNIAYSPRVGFQEAMATGYDATVNETSYSHREHMYDLYGEQVNNLRKLGESEVPSLAHIDLADLSKLYSGESDYQPIDMKDVDAYDNKITALRSKYPEAKLKTTRDMWNEVKNISQQAAYEDAQQSRTIGGHIGAFVGSAAASLDPRYNPLNAATLPFGGFGKTILAKALTEGAVQAGIEATDEMTGQLQARRMVGLDSSWEGSLARIATTAAGGAIVRGAAEGIHVGYKRWFSDTPGDPAPSPPKFEQPAPEETPPQFHDIQFSRLQHADPALASSPMGASRVISDLDEVSRALEDWSGDMPANIKPRTDTAIPTDPQGGVRFSEDATTRAAIGESTVDEIARRIDPEVFGVYDKLASRYAELKSFINDKVAQVEPLRAGELQTVRTAVDDISNRIFDLTEQTKEAGLSKRKLGDLSKRIDQLTQERNAYMARIDHVAGPEVSAARKELIDVETRMRDKAPVVSRAYARARGEWQLGKEYHQAIKNMVNKGESRLPDNFVLPESKLSPSDTPITENSAIHNVKPEDIKHGETVTDAAVRTAANDAKAAEETMAAFRESLADLKDDAEKIMIGNQEVNLKDIVEVPNADGEGMQKITVRELLQDLSRADEDLKAVTKCSI